MMKFLRALLALTLLVQMPAQAGMLYDPATSAMRVRGPGAVVRFLGDTTPDAYTFATINNAPANSVVTFKPTSPLTGYDTPIPVSIPNGQRMSIDDGATFVSGSITLPVPATLLNKWVIEQTTGPQGSQLMATVSAGGLSPSITINTVAAAVANPLTIAPSKVIAWYDGTDRSTMFSDAGVTQTASGGIIQRQLAKTPANPNGDPNFYREEGNDAPGDGANAARRPSHGVAVYNGGQTDGIVFSANTKSLRTRNKTLGITNVYSVLIAMQYTDSAAAGGVIFGIGNRGFNGSDDSNADEFQVKAFSQNQLASSSVSISSGAGLLNATNMEFAHTGTNAVLYLNGTQVATSADTSTLASPVDLNHWYDGAYQGNGYTLSPGHLDKGGTGVEQQFVLLNSPLSTSERTAMQAWLASKAGGSTYNLAVSDAATTTSSPVASGATVIPVVNAARFAPGDKVGLAPAPTTSYGSHGPGGYWPGQQLATDAAVQAATKSTISEYMAAADSGKVYRPREGINNFVGSINNDVLTVTSVTSGQFVGIGGGLFDPAADGSKAFTNQVIITDQLSGTPRQAGTYQLASSLGTVASRALSSRNGGGYYAWAPESFYDIYKIARPLITTIATGGVNTSANTITLSSPILADVPAGAVLAVDNGPVLAGMNYPENATVNLVPSSGSSASGSFYTSGMQNGLIAKGWTINAPITGGVPTMQFTSFRGGLNSILIFFQSSGITLNGIRGKGNFGNDGGLGLGAGPGPNYGKGISFTGSSDTVVTDALMADMPDAAFHSQYQVAGSRGLKDETDTETVGARWIRAKVTRSDAARRYLQWQFNSVSTYAKIEFLDCSFDSDWQTPAAESFESQNAGAIFRRFKSRNGLFSQNTSKNFLVEDSEFIIQPLSRSVVTANGVTYRYPGASGQPVLDINNNSGNVSTGNAGGGGIIRRVNIDIQGQNDAAGNVNKCITINQPDILIEGNFNPTVKNDGSRKGFCRAPYKNSDDNGDNNNSATGPAIYGNKPGLVVKNFRSQPFSYNGSAEPTGFVSPEISNQGVTGATVMDTITGISATRTDASTQSGLVTNPAYMALQ